MSVNIKINVTVPKTILDQQAVVAELKKTLGSKTGPDIRRLFHQTTNTWNPRPFFSMTNIERADALGISVQTYDPRVSYVNFGTRPHVIRPKTSRMLRFQTGYAAKSYPGYLKGKVGGKFGDYISTAMVQHPGVEPRNFDQAIKDEYQDTFEKTVQDAINRAATP